MKKNYKHPRMRAVEIKASRLLSGSETDAVKHMRINMNDYSTYEDKPRSNSVDWNGVGTGSDF